VVDDDAGAAVPAGSVDARVGALAQSAVRAGGAVAAERRRRHVDADRPGAEARRRVTRVQLAATIAVVARLARAPARHVNSRQYVASFFSARCNIYVSRLCYDVDVRLTVCDGRSELAHYS